MFPASVAFREGNSPKSREASSPKSLQMRPDRGVADRSLFTSDPGLGRSSGQAGSQAALQLRLDKSHIEKSSGLMRRPASEIDLRLSSRAQQERANSLHSLDELATAPRSPKNRNAKSASPRSARLKAKLLLNDLTRAKTSAELDEFSLASTSASTNTASPTSPLAAAPSPPQATSLLLKAMQRQCRTEEEDRLGGDGRGSFGKDLCLALARPPSHTQDLCHAMTRPASHGQDLCLALARPPSGGAEAAGKPPPPPSSQRNGSHDNSVVDSARAWSKTAADPHLVLSSRRISKDGDAMGLLARRRMRLPELQPLSREATKFQTAARIRRLDKNEKIFDLYYWNEVIQETGCGGKVVVCSPKVPGERSPLLGPPGSPFGNSSGSHKVKVKVIPGSHVMKMKSKAELRSFGCEEQFRKAHLKMLNLPPHMGILPLYEALEDDSFYYVVMEKANGGSLLTSLVEEFPDGIMPEKAVKRVIKEILSAIEHLHNQGMLHRDIKVDNLVVHVADDVASPGGRIRSVKLIDFDIADPDWIPHSPGKKSRDWVGTMANSAPETFQGVFSQQSDLYSVGTVLYLLMSGRGPYADDLFDLGEFDEMDVVTDRLANADISWGQRCWKEHPSCRDFCMWLLSFDPLARPANAGQAAEHPWFTLGRHK